jgi:hypothetical protein
VLQTSQKPSKNGVDFRPPTPNKVELLLSSKPL